MKISDFITESDRWWENMLVKSPPPNRYYGPDAGHVDSKYAVYINGKLWKKDGKLVSFDNIESANKAADRITAKYNKTTQVVSI